MKEITIDPAWMPRKLKVDWTVEMAEDLSGFQASTLTFDIEAAVEQMLMDELYNNFLFEHL